MIRFKQIMSVAFVILGALVIVQTVRYSGLRFEAWTGIVLGGAMIALGIVRLRASAVRT